MITQPIPQPRAAVYVRVSTSGQEEDGTSLDTQEARCREYAEQQGYRVVATYREVFTGAELHDRPQLSRLREAVRRREVDVIVCYAVDRLSRDQTHIAILLDELERHGARPEFVTEQFENTAIGKFILQARGFAAEIEREKIKERSLRGKRARLEAGKVHNYGTELYGYRRDKERGVRVIYEPEAAIVRDIYRWIVEDTASIRSIQARLNAAGVPAPSAGKRTFKAPTHQCRWGKSSVYRLVRHPAYKGETVCWRLSHHGDDTRAGTMKPESEWVRLPEGTTPPIVSPEVWEAAARRLASNTGDEVKNAARPYLLRGCIICDVCGRRMSASPHHDTRYYRCLSRDTAAGACGAKSTPAEAIEAWLWEQVMHILEDPALITAEAERQRQAGPDPALVASLEAARRNLERLDRQQERNLRAFNAADGDDEEALTLYQRERLRIRQDQERTRATATDLEDRLTRQSRAVIELEAIADYCRHVRHELHRFDFDERRRTLQALQITVRANGQEWAFDGVIPLAGFGGVASTTSAHCARRRRPPPARAWPAPGP